MLAKTGTIYPLLMWPNQPAKHCVLPTQTSCGYGKHQTARWSNHQTVKLTRSSTWKIPQNSEDLFPGDSKCPFHPLVGGHLTPWKGHLTIPKRSLWITRFTSFYHTYFTFSFSSSSNCGTTRNDLREKHVLLGARDCLKNRSFIQGRAAQLQEPYFFSVTSQGLFVITNKQKGKVWKQNYISIDFPDWNIS